MQGRLEGIYAAARAKAGLLSCGPCPYPGRPELELPEPAGTHLRSGRRPAVLGMAVSAWAGCGLFWLAWRGLFCVVGRPRSSRPVLFGGRRCRGQLAGAACVWAAVAGGASGISSGVGCRACWDRAAESTKCNEMKPRRRLHRGLKAPASASRMRRRKAQRNHADHPGACSALQRGRAMVVGRGPAVGAAPGSRFRRELDRPLGSV